MWFDIVHFRWYDVVVEREGFQLSAKGFPLVAAGGSFFYAVFCSVCLL